jgi:hypothetical protein
VASVLDNGPFAYSDRHYVAAAVRLRSARRDYFNAVGSVDTLIVDLARNRYHEAVATVRAEEDRLRS